ncbi:MAG: hypothetical protein M3O31_09730 [Acidobacteriota bacterium]|nr:hypothetical protein [Acidobacteriota bacterium]
MYKPWENKSGLAKALAILATVLGISLGLCGANYAVMIVTHSAIDGFLVTTGMVELIGILGSIIGLIVVAIIAIVRSLFFKDPDRTQ